MDGVDDADAGGDGPALGDRRRQSRGDDRDQRHARPAALLPVPALRSAAEGGSGRDRRPKLGERRMTVRSDEAAAMLADVDSVVAKVKQSRLYRSAALITILWGVVEPCARHSHRARAQLVRPALVLHRRDRSRRHVCPSSLGGRARRALSSQNASGLLSLLRLRLDLGELPRRLRSARTNGVLADLVPVRLRARGSMVRGCVFGDRPRCSRLSFSLDTSGQARRFRCGSRRSQAEVYLLGLWMRRA